MLATASPHRNPGERAKEPLWGHCGLPSPYPCPGEISNSFCQPSLTPPQQAPQLRGWEEGDIPATTAFSPGLKLDPKGQQSPPNLPGLEPPHLPKRKEGAEHRCAYRPTGGRAGWRGGG